PAAGAPCPSRRAPAPPRSAPPRRPPPAWRRPPPTHPPPRPPPPRPPTTPPPPPPPPPATNTLTSGSLTRGITYTQYDETAPPGCDTCEHPGTATGYPHAAGLQPRRAPARQGGSAARSPPAARAAAAQLTQSRAPQVPRPARCSRASAARADPKPLMRPPRAPAAAAGRGGAGPPTDPAPAATRWASATNTKPDASPYSCRRASSAGSLGTCRTGSGPSRPCRALPPTRNRYGFPSGCLPGAVEVEPGADQRRVGQRLGEGSLLLPGGADLLGVRAQVGGVGEHLPERQPRLLQPPAVG